jgi:hypothetical protein
MRKDSVRSALATPVARSTIVVGQPVIKFECPRLLSGRSPAPITVWPLLSVHPLSTGTRWSS